jgi:hypothetical protein
VAEPTAQASRKAILIIAAAIRDPGRSSFIFVRWTRQFRTSQAIARSFLILRHCGQPCSPSGDVEGFKPDVMLTTALDGFQLG